MATFASAMASNTQTCNGTNYLSSGRTALFFKSVRGLNIPSLYQYLREAANESVLDTFLIAFHIRDCRGGKGERELGRRSLVWLFLNYPQQFEKVASLISEYGRWDDLLQLFPSVLNLSDLEYLRKNYASDIRGQSHLNQLRELQQRLVGIMSTQLVKDKVSMESGNPVTLCAKWAPSEKDSLDRAHGVVGTLCSALSISPRSYRKEYIIPLRQYLNIVEKYMCENQWNDIEYSKVPSCAMKRLKKTFEKHSPEKFQSWQNSLQKNEVTVNTGQLQPYELVREIRIKGRTDDVCQAQWNIIEQKVKDLGSLLNTVVVVDISTSMHSPNYIPLDVAVTMGLIISNTVNGPFHNHVITFHNHPTFVHIKDGTLHDRWSQVMRIPWAGCIDIQATFDIILECGTVHDLTDKDMPKKLFIISDVQFDRCNSTKTNFKVVDAKYKKRGYTRPQIVFWNVNGTSTDFQVSVGEHNTVLISGFSPAIMKAILNGKDFSSYSVLRDTLDDERYNPIRKALTTG